MKRLLTFLSLLIVALGSFGQSFTVDGLTYSVLSETNKTVELTSGTAATGDVVVPTSVTLPEKGNYTVASISSNCTFKDNTNITSITIPESFTGFTSVRSYMFSGCTSLKSFFLPNVTSIGSYAFSGCEALEEAIVPKVETLGDYAFYCSYTTNTGFHYCKSLTRVDLSSVKSIGKSVFYECSSLVSILLPVATSISNDAFYKCSSLESVSLPSVTSISDKAFYGCSSLASVSLPVATSIGDYAFSSCSSLASVSLSVATSIGDYAFSSCSSLESVSLPAVNSIGNSAFSYCYNINSLRIGSVEQWCKVIFGEYSSNPLLDTSKSVDLYIGASETPATDIVVPNTVTEIPDYAFRNTTITTLTTANVTSIGKKAFYNCLFLKEVSLPATITIGSSAFMYCKSLESVTMPAVTSIGSFVFCRCSSLKSVSLPAATSIGNSAFYGCSFASISLPVATSIGEEAFRDCSSLVSVSLPVANSICSYAFYDCSSLESVSLPAVTSIGNDAFKSCSNISSLHISSIEQWCKINYGYSSNPLSCTSKSVDLYIGNSESPATAIVLPNTITTIPSYAFRKTTIKEFSAPYVTSIGDYAFKECSNISSLSIPNSLTSIGNGAFSGCTGLSSIYYNARSCSCYSNTFINAGKSSTGISVTIGKDVEIIPGSLFSSNSNSNYPNIKHVKFEKGSTCKTIGSKAFYGCTGFTSISIPSSVTSIEESAFQNSGVVIVYNYSSLPITSGSTDYGYVGYNAYVYNISTVDSVGDYVWAHKQDGEMAVLVKYNGSATSLELPSTYKGKNYDIAYSAFRDCKTLETVITDNNVINIDGYAFYGCTNLQSVILGTGVTSIGDCAFYGCSGLTSITSSRVTPPAVSSSNTFYNVPRTIPVYVPRTAISTYQEKNVWKEFTNITAIPTNELYMDSKIDVTGTELTVPVYMDNIQEICNLQFDVVLPTNIDIFYGENDDEEEVYWVTKGERAKTAHTVAVSKNSDNTYRVLISSSSNAVFKDADKSLPIAYIKLVINESISEGTHKIQLKNAKVTSYNNGTTSLIAVDDASANIIVPPSFTIYASSSNTSQGTVSIAGGKYDASTHKTKFGSSVTLTATAATGYHFEKWTENNATLSTNNPYTLSCIAANHTIKGVFAANPYTVKFTVDGETYSSGSQTYGSVVVAPANPSKTGYKFTGWKNLTSTTTVPAHDVTYEAVFTINQYTVKFVAEGNTVYEKKQDYNSAIVAPDAPTKDRYAFVTWGDVLDKVPANDVTYTAEYVMIGDLYCDEEINVGDLTSLVGIILSDTENLEPRVFKMADVHQDNKINVADYTSLVGMILHDSSSNAKAVTSSSSIGNVAMVMDDFRMTTNEKGCLGIYLQNPNKSIAALQFDIVLPNGIAFTEDNILTPSAALKQSVSYNILNSGALRVMVYSSNNSAIRESKLMDINLSSIVNGDYNIMMKNIVCSSANNDVKELDDVEYKISSTTAINNAKNTNGIVVMVDRDALLIRSYSDTVVDVVNLSGSKIANRMMSTGEEMRLSLPKGVYIVNGVKYILK